MLLTPIEKLLRPMINPGQGTVFRHETPQRRKCQRKRRLIAESFAGSHIGRRDRPVLLFVAFPVCLAFGIAPSLVGGYRKAKMPKLRARPVKAPEEVVVVRPYFILEIIRLFTAKLRAVEAGLMARDITVARKARDSRSRCDRHTVLLPDGIAVKHHAPQGL